MHFHFKLGFFDGIIQLSWISIINIFTTFSFISCSAVEWKLTGEGPWPIDDDIELIFTPGHTRGCVSLLYNPDKALFTGDHLAYSERLGRLTIFRAYNWYNVSLQLESVAKLCEYEFLHVLPGHGRCTAFANREECLDAMQHLLREEGFPGA